MAVEHGIDQSPLHLVAPGLAEGVEQGEVAGDGFRIRGQPLAQLDIAHRHRLGQHVAAGFVQVAGEGAEHGDGPGGVEHLAVHVQAVTVDDRGRCEGGVAAGQVPDLFGFEPQLRGHLLGRVAGRDLFECIEAHGVVGHEVGVEKIVADDLVDHGHGQQAVVAGPDRQPQVGLVGERGAHRVDDHQPGAVFLGPVDRLGRAQGSVAIVLAPDDDEFRVFRLRKGHGTVGIGVGKLAADKADRAVADGVGRTEAVHQPVRVVPGRAPVRGHAAQPGHGAGPGAFAVAAHEAGHPVQGLVPAGLAEFRLPVIAQERPGKPQGRVDDLRGRGQLGAGQPLVRVEKGSAPGAHQAVVTDLGLDGAAGRAQAADGVMDHGLLPGAQRLARTKQLRMSS